MAYIPIPRDLSTVESKVIANLTSRQLICFGLGAAVGIPMFFLLRGKMEITLTMLFSGIAAAPFIIMGILRKGGLTAEKWAINFIRSQIFFPKKRKYETQNFYETLEEIDYYCDNNFNDLNKQNDKKGVGLIDKKSKNKATKISKISNK